MPEAYAPKLRRPATMDHLRRKKPLEEEVPVILDDEPILALESAREALVAALADGGEATEEKAAVEAAKQAVEEATFYVTVRAIGRKNYDALLEEHPPTPEQIKETEELGLGKPIWNAETFPPALVAASAIEPKMTLEEAQEIFDTWNTNETTPLWYAALRVNTNRRVVDLGKGFGETNG